MWWCTYRTNKSSGQGAIWDCLNVSTYVSVCVYMHAQGLHTRAIVESSFASSQPALLLCLYDLKEVTDHEMRKCRKHCLVSDRLICYFLFGILCNSISVFATRLSSTFFFSCEYACYVYVSLLPVCEKEKQWNRASKSNLSILSLRQTYKMNLWA